jgi:integrase
VKKSFPKEKDCPKSTATILKLMKETAMRLGEVWLLEWTDFDALNRTIVCRNPEKRSKPRVFNDLSPNLCRMLTAMPHNSQFIFTCSRKQIDYEDPKTHKYHLKRQKSLLGNYRKRTAEKLRNPRIKKISYHSCRHWKATKLYHQTKDILYVMKFLGHRSIKNTLTYIDLERLCYPNGGDNYTGKVAKTTTEKLQYIEAGFEFVSSDPDGTQYFRKRK